MAIVSILRIAEERRATSRTEKENIISRGMAERPRRSGHQYKLSGQSSRMGEFLRSSRSLVHVDTQGGVRGWRRTKVASHGTKKKKKKKRDREKERERVVHAAARVYAPRPRYEASLRAISNGLHRPSANVKFDVHDYCGPPGRPVRIRTATAKG